MHSQNRMIELKTKGKKILIWLDELSELEEQARHQLENTAQLPWVFRHIAVMPDVHFGKGATVGSVIAMKEAVAPAAVGVDIGCGMAAVQTNLKADDLPESLREIRLDIEKAIPVGFKEHKNPVIENLFPYGENFDLVKKVLKGFSQITSKFHSEKEKVLAQCGTLGGGNHYIELCLDEEDNVWMLLHSGSRNIGKTLAEYHISIAKQLSHNQNLPDKDLAVFLANTKEMKEYKRDLLWAQEYAYLNRVTMLELYFQVLKKHFPNVMRVQTIHCHHNYVSEEIHFGEKVLVTRKGAISARLGEMGIIPGSMGAKS
ncbi:MAG: RtcB family protein, partial [Leptospiraceae bacterium]|nr:RtcB family protein [Leptospiraceae bacterium]